MSLTPWVRWNLIGALAFGGLGLALLLGPAPIGIRAVAFPVLDLVGSAWATLVLIRAAHQSRRLAQPQQAAWFLFALAGGWEFLGVAAGVAQGSGPFPRPAALGSDIFFGLNAATWLTGVSVLPAGPSTSLQRLKRSLDVGVLLVAALLGLASFWFGPLGKAGLADQQPGGWLPLLYPISELAALFALLALVFRPLRDQTPAPLRWLGLALLFGASADLLYAQAPAQRAPLAETWMGLGWLLESACLWAGAAVQWAAPPQLAAPEKSWPHTVRVALPYLGVAGALGLLLLTASPLGVQMPLGLWPVSLGVTLLVGLVLIRQALGLRENRGLSRALQRELQERQSAEAELQQLNAELELRVQSRTEELLRSNQQLREEVAERRRVEEALRRSQAQLTYGTFHDLLTGLPNRVLFMDRLERCTERARRNSAYRFAVLFLDCDGFKLINDSLGHPLGDRVLLEIASRLQSGLRAVDTVARLGGDEFVILLDDLRAGLDARQTAERLQTALRAPFPVTDPALFISASIGIVLSGPAADHPEDIVRDAEVAMYQAKQLGKGQTVIFAPDMRARTIARLSLERDLRGALERHELALHYQPILDLKTLRLSGFEALLRWHHPQLGLMPPADFIPLAEETGLINGIGEWALREACRQVAVWQARFAPEPPFTINVNLSVGQLQQTDLVERVDAILRAAQLTPGSLHLEVTESAILEDAPDVLRTLTGLRALGVHVQIDDFGTGYSSLSYLYRFPVDALKIDRAFVNRITATGENASLVRTITALAHELGLGVIAEGVETPEQIRAVTEAGCEQAQGYLISRPLESSRVADFITGESAYPAAGLRSELALT